MTDETPAPPAGDPMPVFTIKAKDNYGLVALDAYRRECVMWGNSDQAEEVMKAIREIVAWRRRNRHLCKDPDHQHVPATTSPEADR